MQGRADHRDASPMWETGRHDAREMRVWFLSPIRHRGAGRTLYKAQGGLRFAEAQCVLELLRDYSVRPFGCSTRVGRLRSIGSHGEKGEMLRVWQLNVHDVYTYVVGQRNGYIQLIGRSNVTTPIKRSDIVITEKYRWGGHCGNSGVLGGVKPESLANGVASSVGIQRCEFPECNALQRSVRGT